MKRTPHSVLLFTCNVWLRERTPPPSTSPLLIPLSHRTGSTYSTTPERGEWGEKGYYDSEGRKERERQKRRADRVLWARGMRAVKAFGVFIRFPKPRALLPIRLVDTARHVNEMQSRETLTSLSQFVGAFLSFSTNGFVLLSACLPCDVTLFLLDITVCHLQPLILPSTLRNIMIRLLFLFKKSWTLCFSSL